MSEYEIRAINLKDLSEIILLEDENGRNLITVSDIALDRHHAVWTYARPTPDLKRLDEMVIATIDFDTGERRELIRTKIDGSFWSILGISGNLAVIEQEFEDVTLRNRLYSLDITNGISKDLSRVEKSYLSESISPWVVWKSGASHNYWYQAVLFNLESGQEFSIRKQGDDPSDPKIDGTRVYWTGSIPSTHGITNAIYIYEIGENKIYVLHAPGEDQYYRSVAIHNNTIAWVRTTEMSKAVSDIYLEWTTFR
jgi:hypothetical protein